ncbi:E3 ubiquitin-protein ligase RNF25 [Oopsacas minuta]|uniref:E3 ubiquitin-protein ligase RNF25 n=1 Tax=Oopsacas minuta TaxID=111878 RepID=A0AAV7JF39_9METZ|nr:E3 ubiquitin-protein ligase RNF25 [Oopsacas minuta]
MADKPFTRMESTCLEDEIDFLSAVFFEELQISDVNTPQNEKILFLNLEPSTADDKTKQFVFVKLKVVIPIDYPAVSPIWSTVNSRGLSDEILNNLLAEARQVSETKIGHSMLYEVIEQLKVYLTEQNKPSEACCVCMCEFDAENEYTKTNCFHYLHLACFASYVQIELERIREVEMEDQVAGLKKNGMQLECPVCREIISADSQCMEDIKEIHPDSFFNSQASVPVFKLTKTMRDEQAKRAELFQKQMAAGGIIDLKEEAARFDMDTAWRPPSPEKVEEPEIDQPEEIAKTPVNDAPFIFTEIKDEEKVQPIDPQHEAIKQTTANTKTKQTSPKKSYSRDNYNYYASNDYRYKPRRTYKQERNKNQRNYQSEYRPSYQQDRDSNQYDNNYDNYKPRHREYRGKDRYTDDRYKN